MQKLPQVPLYHSFQKIALPTEKSGACFPPKNQPIFATELPFFFSGILKTIQKQAALSNCENSNKIHLGNIDIPHRILV